MRYGRVQDGVSDWLIAALAEPPGPVAAAAGELGDRLASLLASLLATLERQLRRPAPGAPTFKSGPPLTWSWSAEDW